jgi:hypothetical protein
MSVLRDREVDESIKSKRLKDEITLLKLGHSKTIKGLHEDLTLLNVEHSKTIKELEISNETCKNLKNLNETSNLNINALRKEIEMVTKRLTSTFKKLSIDCDSDSDDNEYEFRSISLLSKLIKKINPFPSLISTLETQNSSLMKTNLEIQTKLTSLEATKNNQDSCYKTMEMKLDNLTMDNARFQIEAQLIQNQNGIEKTLQRLENSILMRSEAIVNPETMDFDELNSNSKCKENMVAKSTKGLDFSNVDSVVELISEISSNKQSKGTKSDSNSKQKEAKQPRKKKGLNLEDIDIQPTNIGNSSQSIVYFKVNLIQLEMSLNASEIPDHKIKQKTSRPRKLKPQKTVEECMIDSEVIHDEPATQTNKMLNMDDNEIVQDLLNNDSNMIQSNEIPTVLNIFINN